MYSPTAPIHMSNATQALQAGAREIETGETEFSLAGLRGSDSSAIAVLLAWQRQAQQKKQGLRFTQVPETLASFAGLYGVDALLSGFAAHTGAHTAQ